MAGQFFWSHGGECERKFFALWRRSQQLGNGMDQFRLCDPRPNLHFFLLGQKPLCRSLSIGHDDRWRFGQYRQGFAVHPNMDRVQGKLESPFDQMPPHCHPTNDQRPQKGLRSGRYFLWALQINQVMRRMDSDKTLVSKHIGGVTWGHPGNYAQSFKNIKKQNH